ERPILHPPLHPDHFLARERVLGCRDGADGGAGPALVAHGEVGSVQPDYLALPVEIGMNRHRHDQRSPRRFQNPFIGFGPTLLITFTNSSSIAGIRWDSEIASSITLTRSGSSARRSSVSCTFPIRVCSSSLPRMKWHW